jgi:predicted transcriptional regulator
MEKNIVVLMSEIKNETGFDQTELAKLLGTSQPTVHRILSGQDECKLKTLRAIVDLHKKTFS